ncbi:MAG: hypothetical protein KC419_14390, partial [Anaerolineales bacterium]|nr:hypothetical protein [Anaerolineales bacterium]
MIKRVSIGILMITTLLVSAGFVLAQGSEARGSIRGAIYEDVNGDGICVNSGVAGENPVAGVDIEFVSSDEAVVIT